MTSSVPIHLLHVVPMLGVGGMELTLSRIVRGLAAPDMVHSVCCLKGEPLIKDRLGNVAGVYCMNAGRNDPLLPFRLRKLIHRVRPTLIHVRNWGAWPDVAVARLLTRPRVPLIFSFHGLESAGPLPLYVSLAFRVLRMITTHVFTVSDATRNMLVEHVGLPPWRVGVIPNGVDVEVLLPGGDREPSSRLVVGTAGGLKPVKNHALLVRACAAALRRGVDLELRIAGEGGERGRIEETARALGLRERVHLVGPVTRMVDFLRGLDLFVLPSDSEAHPNALLEAMACGLPCVATEVGGAPETLDFGRSGLLVAPSDEAELADAIVRLAGDRPLMRRLGTAARHRACTVYSLQEMLRAYDSLYRGLTLHGGTGLQPAPESC